MNTQVISITLDSSVDHLSSGKVNGRYYNWRQDGDTWTATVSAVLSGKYVVELTLYNVLRHFTEQTLVLYYGLNLVRDREQADVERIRYLLKKLMAGTATEAEREEFLEPVAKGAYNYTDFNRVGAAVAYLKERLASMWGVAVQVNAKQDWTEEDVPTVSAMAAYLDDIRTIRGALAAFGSVPEVPDDMAMLTWQEANHIEQILWYADELIFYTEQAWRYAGEYFSGE